MVHGRKSIQLQDFEMTSTLGNVPIEIALSGFETFLWLMKNGNDLITSEKMGQGFAYS